MRLLLLAVLLLLPAFGRAALPQEFESSNLNRSGVLYLKAAATYGPLSPDEKTSSVEKAAGSLAVANGTVVVQSGAAGEIWSVRGGKAEKLDGWSDTTLPLNPKTNNAGRWFASFGMQSMSGGPSPSGTINMRLGSTLYKGRYDLALSYDYNKLSDAELGQASLGVVGRALIPLTRHGGWNIGAQLTRTNSFGVASDSVGLVTGLNIYLPRGTFDITLNLQEKGAYGVLAGYTIFITR